MNKTFGKYAIIDPVKHVFEKEPDWYWMINPVTAKGQLSVQRVLSQDRTRVEVDGTRISLYVTTLEVAMREVAVTFGGTNIPTSETDPAPILKKSASVEEVEAVLAEMPRGMLFELWKAVGKAVPGFGPATVDPKAKQKTEEPDEEGEAKN
jgi:hypothetical protein